MTATPSRSSRAEASRSQPAGAGLREPGGRRRTEASTSLGSSRLLHSRWRPWLRSRPRDLGGVRDRRQSRRVGAPCAGSRPRRLLALLRGRRSGTGAGAGRGACVSVVHPGSASPVCKNSEGSPLGCRSRPAADRTLRNHLPSRARTARRSPSRLRGHALDWFYGLFPSCATNREPRGRGSSDRSGRGLRGFRPAAPIGAALASTLFAPARRGAR
jgi:hypothetical protein